MEALVQAERLVQQFYRSATPLDVTEVQKKLQDVQRAAGWQLANGLMQSKDQNVRFFAALTFTVKLNQEGSSLSDTELTALLSTLLNWTISLIRHGEGALVLRKLCSTLVTLFLLSNSSWKRCIRHLLCCLRLNTYMHETDLDDFPSTEELLRDLEPRQVFLVVIFAKHLAEDASRIEHSSQLFNYCHERVALNLLDALTVVNHSLALMQAQPSGFSKDTFECYQAWISYISQEYDQSSEQMQALHTLVARIVDCLFIEHLFQEAAEFLADLFRGDENFLSAKDSLSFAELLDTPWALDRLMKFGRDPLDEDCVQFAQVVTTFAQATSKMLIKQPNEFKHVIAAVHRITVVQRYETIDQSLSNAIVDFWESFNAQSSDLVSEVEQFPELFDNAKREWLQGMKELCSSSTLPQDIHGDIVRLRTDHPFSEHRARVKSAVHSSYEVYASSILDTLVALAIQYHEQYSATSSPWPSVEAIFNSLEGLSESMRYQASDIQVEDEILQQLFSSSLYQHLTNFSITIPSRLRKKAFSLIGEHHEFLGRHPDFLLSALDVLFCSLQEPAFADVAARAVFLLSDANRKILGPKLEALLLASERYYLSANSTSSSKAKIAAAISAVAQALSPELDQVLVANRLIDMIEHDYHTASHYPEEAISVANHDQSAQVIVLEQLKAVSKAWQMPDHIVIDLDADHPGKSEIWKSTQVRLVTLFKTLSNHDLHEGDRIEAICEIIQSGYRETKPGPFVFEPAVTIEFVTAMYRLTPRLDVAIRTAAMFVSARGTTSPLQPHEISTISDWLSQIIDDQLATEDPELAHACVDFLNRLIPRHIQNLTQMPPTIVETFFGLALQCLAGTGVLAKRSAATFWTSILTISSHSVQSFITTVLEAYGSSLVRALIFGFAGNAARSELEWITEPYRKLVFRQPRTAWKLWSEQALTDPAFPSGRVSEVEKRRFLSQVERLRGDRKTNSVVREFWLACRGAPVAYG